VLFGRIYNDPNPDTDCHYRPYLEITDPTNRTCSTTLELDKSIFKHASKHTTAHIRVCSGAGHAKGILAEKEGMPFVSDASRGIIGAEVYWYTPDSQQVQNFESSVFVMDVEGVLSRIPSSLDLERRRVKWKDLSPSTAIFSYDSQQIALHRLLARYSYVVGFRYVSPTQPLSPGNSTGPRCFFVYDFNPHRETPDPLPGATPGGPDPETGFPKSASEITREVIGGLSCWKMRFDLPAAEEGLDECRVALTDGGVVLFEVRCLTISSDGFDNDMRSLKVLLFRKGIHYGFLDLVMCLCVEEWVLWTWFG
jgi:hypothetical protein